MSEAEDKHYDGKNGFIGSVQKGNRFFYLEVSHLFNGAMNEDFANEILDKVLDVFNAHDGIMTAVLRTDTDVMDKHTDELCRRLTGIISTEGMPFAVEWGGYGLSIHKLDEVKHVPVAWFGPISCDEAYNVLEYL